MPKLKFVSSWSKLETFWTFLKHFWVFFSTSIGKWKFPHPKRERISPSGAHSPKSGCIHYEMAWVLASGTFAKRCFHCTTHSNSFPSHAKESNAFSLGQVHPCPLLVIFFYISKALLHYLENEARNLYSCNLLLLYLLNKFETLEVITVQEFHECECRAKSRWYLVSY